jgi:hypothetical protein
MKRFTLALLAFITVNAFASDYSFTIGGKQYKIVKTKKSWTDAAAWAVSDGGHLVHIGSKAEQDSIYAAVQASGISTTYTSVPDGGGVAYIWIGATDKKTEGTWLWDGDNDGNGTNFYTGQGSWGANNGAPVNGAYVNWGGTNTGSGSNEPDDYGSSQDGAAIALAPWPMAGAGNIAGEWNDIDISNQLYFIVEYETSGINNNKSVKPNIDIILKGNKQIGLKSTKALKSVSIVSVTGQEVVKIDAGGKTFIIIGLPSKGIFIYRGEFENGIVKTGKILVL